MIINLFLNSLVVLFLPFVSQPTAGVTGTPEDIPVLAPALSPVVEIEEFDGGQFEFHANAMSRLVCFVENCQENLGNNLEIYEDGSWVFYVDNMAVLVGCFMNNLCDDSVSSIIDIDEGYQIVLYSGYNFICSDLKDCQ